MDGHELMLMAPSPPWKCVVDPYTDKEETALNFLCYCQKTEPRVPTYAAQVKLALCRRCSGPVYEVRSNVKLSWC
jgi:hypothetical protein